MSAKNQQEIGDLIFDNPYDIIEKKLHNKKFWDWSMMYERKIHDKFFRYLERIKHPILEKFIRYH